MMISTDERTVEKIAQLIWILGNRLTAGWRCFLISSSFLLNHEPILILEGMIFFLAC